MRFSIKTKKTFLLLGTILIWGVELQTQSFGQNNGIHVQGGYSSSDSISSNIGDTCNATGFCSFAGGYRSNAQGSFSFAYGNRSQAYQSNAYALGYMATANGRNSFSLGYYTQANNNGSIVIGSGAHAFAMLTSPASGISMGMGSSLPTLFISPAAGNLMTGKVGIGNVSNPQAKLHIAADEYEDASLFLQPTGKNGEISSINMTDSNHQILVREDGSMCMIANNSLLVSGSNVNLSENTVSFGGVDSRRFYATVQNNPAICSNAFRLANAYYSYSEGPSYAIEFNGNGMLFRTAANEMPRNLPISNWRDALSIKTNGAITLTGKVGVNIENTTASYALAVDGGLITTKVFIQDVDDWPDYVFDDTYRLMPLHELKNYIGANRHLPEMPSEDEVAREGYDLNGMQQALVKKIEELTLYTLKQQEEIEALRKMVEELKGK